MKRVEIKKVKGCKAAVIKGKGPYDKIGPVFAELYEWLSNKSRSYLFGIYVDRDTSSC